MKTLITLLCSMVLVHSSLIAQIAVNRNWVATEGQADSIAFSKTIVDQYGNIITVGNSKNQNGDADIHVQSVAHDGGVNWTYDYDHSGLDDYGTALVSDNSGGVYVCGAVSNSSYFDYAIMHVDNSGNLDWINTSNAESELNDIPVSIVKIEGENLLVITGGAEQPGSSSNIYTVAFDVSNGSAVWAAEYDYAEMIDAAIDVSLAEGGNILVTGLSADGNGLFDNVSILYDPNGNVIDEVRVSQGYGLDKPRAIVKDSDGNWYLTGVFQNTPYTSEIVIYKISSELNVVWNISLNPSDGIDEVFDITIDSSGNVIVVGFTTDQNGQKLSYVASIDPSSDVNWEKSYKLLNKQIKGKHLAVDSDGGIEMLGEVSDGVHSKLLLVRYTPEGDLFFARTVHIDAEYYATDVKARGEKVYITGQGKDTQVGDFITLEYTWDQNEMNAVLDGEEKPLYVDDELLIRFNPDYMLMDAIDNKDKEYGQLNDFVSQEVISAMNEFVEFEFGRQTVYKVFRSITSKDSITMSRQGHEVRQPKLWSTLNVQVPEDADFNALQGQLESLFPFVYYTDMNLFGEFHGVIPNDTFYSIGSNLHPTPTYNLSHINVEPAWELTTGSPSIRVGVFDTGIEQDHDDFQFQGNTIIQDVWDFRSNTSWISNTNADSSGHGTWMAGIIGAVRNNSIGNAGIAGGHDSTSTVDAIRGVSMYGLRIESGNWFAPVLSYFAEAMYISTLSEGEDFAYGLHLQNFSTTLPEGTPNFTDTNINLLRDATHATFRNGVIMVSARGNEHSNNKRYPSVFDDNWVINVGGIGDDGQFLNGSSSSGCEPLAASYGRNVDVAAPGATCNVRLIPKALFGANDYYEDCAGTSAATAHVSGVGGLLLSYLNDSATEFFLHPEDVENVLQISATQTGSSSYDTYTGHGKLNAGEALRLVEKPNKRIEHHGTISTSGTVNRIPHTTGVQIELVEDYETPDGQFYQAGQYTADVYEISAHISHVIDTSDTMVGHWVRNDETTVLPLYNASNELVPHEQAFWTSTINETEAELHGYVYHLKDWPSGTNDIGWIPQDTSIGNAIFEYSVLIHPKSIYNDTNDSIIDTTTFVSTVNDKSINVSIHPNPTHERHILKISNPKGAPIVMELYEITGRKVQSMNYFSRNESEFAIEQDTRGLSQGLYFYRVMVGDTLFQIPFIKTE